MNDAGMHVLLVGAAAPEEALRAAGAGDFERIPSSLDAVARLHELASDTDWSLCVVASQGALADGDDAGDLVRGLRLAAPRARLVWLGEAPNLNGEAVDAVLNGHAGEGDWRRALGLAEARREQPPATAGPAPSPAPSTADDPTEPAGAPPPPAEPAPPPAGSIQPRRPTPAPAQGDDAVPDERGVVLAMLQARDPVAPALQLISAELGRQARFEQGDPGEGESGDGEPVAWGERPYGRLLAPGADPQALKSQAVRLAAWLRLAEQQSELRRAALTDPLTGAWNRRYFERFLPAALEQARRKRGSVTLLVFDIDDFKIYNERYGHAAGDEILGETVRLLRSVIRPTDKVCRIGGDEFVVIFHEPEGPREPGSRPPESVYQISRRFQRQICEHRFPKLADEAPGTLTISGGLATYPWDGRDSAELLEQADQLALESKRIGKNAITLGPGAALVCGTNGGAHPGERPSGD